MTASATSWSHTSSHSAAAHARDADEADSHEKAYVSHAHVNNASFSLDDDDAIREDDEDEDEDEDSDNNSIHSSSSSSSLSSSSSSCASSSWSNSYSSDSDHGDEDDAGMSQDEVDWRRGEAAVAPALLDRYYAAECAGRSCAVELYELTTLLNRLESRTLWRAAVGLWDLRARRLIDAGCYLVEMRPLHEAVSLMRHRQPNSAATTAHATADAHSRLREHAWLAARGADAMSESGQHSVSSASSSSDSREAAMRLHLDEEDGLFLLRHTTLWNAIWLHPHVASVCGLHHKEDGTGFLAQLLASRCGVSMNQAQQPWCQLPREVRRDVLPRVRQELRKAMDRRRGLAAGGVRHGCDRVRCAV